MTPVRSDVRSLDRPDRQWIMWEEDGVFTKNPDIVLLPSGKLLCVFCATDFHWAGEFSKITLLESTDRGRTWGRPRIIAAAYPAKGDERWVTPRLARLRDGRLVINCDQNDYRHCHESQPPGIYTWWSSDDGETWDGPYATGVIGIEPDRVRELPDGTLVMGSHYTRSSTQKTTEAVTFSRDGGKTWGERIDVASDMVHRYCEGAVIPLRNGRLLDVMRENNHNNYPSYFSFSDDNGRTWTAPEEAPFAGDRPFAGELQDGRLLVTFRNQAGKPGLYAWCGDIEKERGYKMARAQGTVTHTTVRTPGDTVPRVTGGVSLEKDCIVMQNGAEFVTRYLLLPPQSFMSHVRFECELAVSGAAGEPAATIQIARIGVVVTVTPEAVYLGGRARQHHPSFSHRMDMTVRRRLSIEHKGGLLTIAVDDRPVLYNRILIEELWDRSFFGNGPDHQGSVRWYNARYFVNNQTERPHNWQWDAGSGQYPNQYEIDHWLEVDYNSNPHPDHGYSSWVQFADGEIFLADYSNEGAAPGKARLKGYRLYPQDLP